MERRCRTEVMLDDVRVGDLRKRIYYLYPKSDNVRYSEVKSTVPTGGAEVGGGERTVKECG